MKKIICILFLMVGISLSAQNVAVKTNLLYDASATINLGTEIGLAPKWTLDLSANYNSWTFSENKKWKHWLAQPEARYWFCERFNGHFLGAHLLGGQYNWGGIKLPFGLFDDLENHRYEGCTPAVVWYTVTSGCWASAGASKRPSVWAISVPIMTSTSVCIAVNGWVPETRTTWG